MRVHRLPNRIVMNIGNDEAPMTCRSVMKWQASSPLISILSPRRGAADRGDVRSDVVAAGEVGRLSSLQEERGRVRSWSNAEGTKTMRPGVYGVRGHVRAFKSGDMSPHSKYQRLPRVRQLEILLALLVVCSTCALTKGASPMQLPGYKAVPVRYGPLNKMIMSVRINGQPANLLVDTGASQLILDAAAAESFGVRPSQRGLRYIRFAQVNGQDLPVGFAQNLAAGSMNFGSSPVALRSSIHSGTGSGHIDGVLGLDILRRYKTVINCRTKLVFFKVDQARQMNLSPVASSQKFTRVPLRWEENGALTVPCSIHGQFTHLLVDTGAFVTAFDQTLFKALGIASEPTRVSAHFASGAAQRISAGKLNDLKIGDFKVPPEKFGVTALPDFALRQGTTSIGGILGMDTLYICQAIIDLDNMNLFLK
jgi:predicted aspartyl protease